MSPHKQKIGVPAKVKKTVRYIERGIIVVLIAMMAFLLLLATVELIFNVFKMLFTGGENSFLVDLDGIMDAFGVFLYYRA